VALEFALAFKRAGSAADSHSPQAVATFHFPSRAESDMLRLFLLRPPGRPLAGPPYQTRLE